MKFRSFKKSRAALLLAAGLGANAPAGAAPEPAGGPCPLLGQAPCVLTLSGKGAPSASAACASEEWASRLTFTQPGKWSDSNHDGWWETVLGIRLDPARDCGCARFKVSFGEPGGAWMVNIGNSPTNNGHGGDEGTTPNAAEVQVVGKHLAVFTASRPNQPQVDKLLDVTLPPLRERTLEFEVCNQVLRIGMVATARDRAPSEWSLESLNSKLLFSLAPGDPSSLYAAFNRVIHALSGAASHDRVGSGVRRVEISLTP